MRQLTYVLLLMYLTNTAGKSKSKRHRILGGTVAKKDQFPFFAQLHIAGRATCGASLIDQEWLVSAGHCFNKFENLDKLADEDELKVYMKTNIMYDKRADINFIKKVHFHPHFEWEEDIIGGVVKSRNDIVLALLKSPYMLQNAIWPIFLPKPIRNIKKWMRHCTSGIVVGVGIVKDQTDRPVFGKYVKYGRAYPKTPEEFLKIIDPHRYMSLDSFPYNIYRNSDEDTMDLNKSILTLTPWHTGHAMRGDSGGPFVCYHRNNAVLYGIVSLGVPVTDPYNEEYHLGINERIDVHLDFILSMVPHVQIYHPKRKLGITLKQNGKN